MRVPRSLPALCLLLSAACGDDDPGFRVQVDSGGNTLIDSGGGAVDSGSVVDGGPRDSGTVAMDSGPSAMDSGALDSGPSDAGDGADAVIARSMGSWVVYPNPYASDASADGGPNPATGIMGSAVAVRAGDGGMTVTLMVSGLPGARDFGSHVHKAECETGMAGGHFQHMPFPEGGTATDPTYANPMNEVWLDFKTDDAGAATGSATVGFVPAPGGAKAIIVHDRKTGDGGVAGPKLACLPMAF